jgi:hypothetical protein
MNELNTKLQGAYRLVNELFDKISMFETKRQLWELQQLSNNRIYFRIPRTEKPTDVKNFLEESHFL